MGKTAVPELFQFVTYNAIVQPNLFKWQFFENEKWNDHPKRVFLLCNSSLALTVTGDVRIFATLNIWWQVIGQDQRTSERVIQYH